MADKLFTRGLISWTLRDSFNFERLIFLFFALIITYYRSKLIYLYVTKSVKAFEALGKREYSYYMVGCLLENLLIVNSARIFKNEALLHMKTGKKKENIILMAEQIEYLTFKIFRRKRL